MLGASVLRSLLWKERPANAPPTSASRGSSSHLSRMGTLLREGIQVWQETRALILIVGLLYYTDKSQVLVCDL